MMPNEVSAMLKKMVILGVIGFVAVTALGGTRLASYIRAEIAAARERAEANVPPEKEIARLRHELKLLDKDIMTVVDQLARETVAVKNLQKDVDERAAKQEQAAALLKSRAEAIKNAEGHVTFGSRTMTVDVAKVELEDGVRIFTANQKTLETLKATVATRTKVRENLEKQLEALKNQKVELAAAIDGMEAELAALKLQQMESKYQTDDTRLAKIKEDLKKLKDRVDVEREKLKLMPAALDAPAKPAVNSKSVDDIMAPLNAPAKPAAKPEGSKADKKVPLAD
jgi:DNA repair exonuclease SbcCD ATPase subunit